MTLARLTASTAALLLSSTALVAQEGQSRTFENVYIDVEGSAVLVPVDLALEACGLDAEGIQQAANSRLDTSGLDAEAIFAQINAGDPMGGAAAGAEGQNAAAADASGAAATDDAAATDTDTAAADAGAAGTEGAAETTATADASAAAEDAAAGTQSTDTATADASGAAGQDATAADPEGSTEVAGAGDAAQSGDAAGSVENVEATAAETNTTVTNAQGTNDPTTTAPGEDYLALAVCQIDVVRASELGIPNIANETVTE